jgi:hypothetical protein
MTDVTTIAIALAKKVFQLCGLNCRNKVPGFRWIVTP